MDIFLISTDYILCIIIYTLQDGVIFRLWSATGWRSDGLKDWNVREDHVSQWLVPTSAEKGGVD